MDERLTEFLRCIAWDNREALREWEPDQQGIPELFKPGIEGSIIAQRVLVIPKAILKEHSGSKLQQSAVQLLCNKIVLCVRGIPHAKDSVLKALECSCRQSLAQEEPPELTHVIRLAALPGG